MSVFKIGQKVICKDPSPKTSRRMILIKNRVYTIEDIQFCPGCGVECLILKEISDTGESICFRCGSGDWIRLRFRSERFEPLLYNKCKINQVNINIIEERIDIPIKKEVPIAC